MEFKYYLIISRLSHHVAYVVIGHDPRRSIRSDLKDLVDVIEVTGDQAFRFIDRGVEEIDFRIPLAA